MNHNPQLERTEYLISYFLRYGVLLSAAFFFAGLVASWWQPGAEGFAPATTAPLLAGQKLSAAPVTLDPWSLLHGMAHGNPAALITIGLVLLVALPIGRVALTVIVFFHQRDWFYFAITCIVLTILLTGLFFGKSL